MLLYSTVPLKGTEGRAYVRQSFRYQTVFLGSVLGCIRHSGVMSAVAVGFSGTNGGHNHWQGASFARADVQLPVRMRGSISTPSIKQSAFFPS